MEGENRVLATAQQIIKSLHTGNVDTDDMLLIFSNFDNRLSNLSNFIASSSSTSTPSSAKASAAAAAGGGGDDDDSFVDRRFEDAEKLILDGADPSSTDDYLAAVDEIIRLTEDLDLPPTNDSVMDRAEAALQLAMAHLEDEFRHILIRTTSSKQWRRRQRRRSEQWWRR